MEMISRLLTVTLPLLQIPRTHPAVLADLGTTITRSFPFSIPLHSPPPAPMSAAQARQTASSMPSIWTVPVWWRTFRAGYLLRGYCSTLGYAERKVVSCYSCRLVWWAPFSAEGCRRRHATPSGQQYTVH
jgi:hypothetical protein